MTRIKVLFKGMSIVYEWSTAKETGKSAVSSIRKDEDDDESGVRGLNFFWNGKSKYLSEVATYLDLTPSEIKDLQALLKHDAGFDRMEVTTEIEEDLKYIPLYPTYNSKNKEGNMIQPAELLLPYIFERLVRGDERNAIYGSKAIGVYDENCTIHVLDLDSDAIPKYLNNQIVKMIEQDKVSRMCIVTQKKMQDMMPFLYSLAEKFLKYVPEDKLRQRFYTDDEGNVFYDTMAEDGTCLRINKKSIDKVEMIPNFLRLEGQQPVGDVDMFVTPTDIFRITSRMTCVPEDRITMMAKILELCIHKIGKHRLDKMIPIQLGGGSIGKSAGTALPYDCLDPGVQHIITTSKADDLILVFGKQTFTIYDDPKKLDDKLCQILEHTSTGGSEPRRVLYKTSQLVNIMLDNAPIITCNELRGKSEGILGRELDIRVTAPDYAMTTTMLGEYKELEGPKIRGVILKLIQLVLQQYPAIINEDRMDDITPRYRPIATFGEVIIRWLGLKPGLYVDYLVNRFTQALQTRGDSVSALQSMLGELSKMFERGLDAYGKTEEHPAQEWIKLFNLTNQYGQPWSAEAFGRFMSRYSDNLSVFGYKVARTIVNHKRMLSISYDARNAPETTEDSRLGAELAALKEPEYILKCKINKKGRFA